MKPDSIIKSEGMDILIKKLGRVDAERFVSLLLEEPFDYTEWQKDIMKDMSVEEISKNAIEYREKKNNSDNKY